MISLQVRERQQCGGKVQMALSTYKGVKEFFRPCAMFSSSVGFEF